MMLSCSASRSHLRNNNKKRMRNPRMRLKNPIFFRQTCKPGSVLDDHLSRTYVAIRLKQPT